jgi:hypothetical protein
VTFYRRYLFPKKLAVEITGTKKRPISLAKETRNDITPNRTPCVIFLCESNNLNTFPPYYGGKSYPVNTSPPSTIRIPVSHDQRSGAWEKIPGPAGPDRFVRSGIGRTSVGHVECVPVSVDVSFCILAFGFRSHSLASTHHDMFALLSRGVKITIAVQVIRLNSVPDLPSRLLALHFLSASSLVVYEVQDRCGCLC